MPDLPPSSSPPPSPTPRPGNSSPPNSSPSPKTTASVPAREVHPFGDISPLLANWQYQPGTINVRTIVGSDGRNKLQMRLDLGLLQMEVSGRPDGERPYGFESLLEYHEHQLEDYKKSNGHDVGFHLTRSQCESLRHEAAMYYQRYLSFFALEDFRGVMRDTARNLRVLDLCGRFAMDEQDRVWLEQYRPYILMMHSRAKASLLLRENKPAEAYRAVRHALKRIREFFEHFQQPDAYRHANEVKVLKRFARELKGKLPVDPLKALQQALERAVRAERYEEAARLRDEIAQLQANPPAD